MKSITIDLTPLEEAAMGGWVKYYQLNPQYIGVLPPPNPPWPPNYQTRIVLDSCTRDRFDEIAKQFALVVEPYVVLREFKNGDPRFVFTSQNTPISAIPFRVPTAWSEPAGSASAAEYGTGGTGFAQAAINILPGDMTGATGSASNLTIDWVAGEGIFLPGALLYYNHKMAEGHNARGTGFSVGFPKQ